MIDCVIKQFTVCATNLAQDVFVGPKQNKWRADESTLKDTRTPVAVGYTRQSIAPI